MHLFACLFIFTLLSSCSYLRQDLDTAKPDIQRVVLVSIDGLRPDAINKSNASNLYKLSRNSLYFPLARTIQRSVTLPSHTSMLTGLDVTQHKVTKNKSLPGYLPFPTVLTMLKQQGKSTAAFYSKKKLNHLLPPDSVDYLYGTNHDGVGYHQTNANDLAAEFARTWNEQGYNMTFIHIREPDSTGHKHGWMSPEYLNQAVPAADAAIGTIYNSILNSQHADNTLLIITADHGGKDKTHWYERPEDLTIPWMAIHPGIKAETVNNSQVIIYDTTPTILYLLGMPVPADLDGKIIKQFQN